MIDKSVLGHSLLAVACTLAAYIAWTAPNITENDDSAIVVHGRADALTRIAWHDETADVIVSREADAIEVSVTRPGPSAVQTFPGTEQARDLFGKLAPLRAARALGKVTEQKAKTFGLDAPKNKLTLQFGATPKVVELGANTFGSGDSYARGPDGEVYLLRSSVFSTLSHGALALQDRDVLGLTRAKFDRLAVTLPGGKRRELVQRHGDEADPSRAFVADPAEPDRKLEMASTWLDRVLRLRVSEVGQTAPTGEPALSIEFSQDRTRTARLQVWPLSDKGAVAVSSHFKTPVLLYKGAVEGIVRDAESVLNEGR